MKEASRMPFFSLFLAFEEWTDKPILYHTSLSALLSEMSPSSSLHRLGFFILLPDMLFTIPTYPTSLTPLKILSRFLSASDICSRTCAGGPFRRLRIVLLSTSPLLSRSFSRVLFRTFSRRASMIISCISFERGVTARFLARVRLSFKVSRCLLMPCSMKGIHTLAIRDEKSSRTPLIGSKFVLKTGALAHTFQQKPVFKHSLLF